MRVDSFLRQSISSKNENNGPETFKNKFQLFTENRSHEYGFFVRKKNLVENTKSMMKTKQKLTNRSKLSLDAVSHWMLKICHQVAKRPKSPSFYDGSDIVEKY